MAKEGGVSWVDENQGAKSATEGGTRSAGMIVGRSVLFKPWLFVPKTVISISSSCHD